VSANVRLGLRTVRLFAASSVWILLFSTFTQVVASEGQGGSNGVLTGVTDKASVVPKSSPWDLSVKPLTNKSGGYAYSANAKDFAVSFKDGSGNGSEPIVSLNASGHSVGYAPRSIGIKDQVSPSSAAVSNVSATKNGASLEYADSLGEGIDVSYEMAINGLKETFRVSDRPGQKGDLTIHGALFYDTSSLAVYVDGEEVTSSVTTNGSVEFRNSTGSVVMLIPKGWARDSSVMQVEGDPGLYRSVNSPRWSEVRYYVERHGDITFFDVGIPGEFLQDSNITYPVMIDPSLGPTIADFQEYDNEEIGQTSGLTILSHGTLVIRNSTFAWETDDTLTVEPGATLVFDNSTMTSDSYGSTYDVEILGDFQAINSQIGGRISAFLVAPPSSAGFRFQSSAVSNELGDCLALGGQTTPIDISGSTFGRCPGAALRLFSPGVLANTWSITDSTFDDSLYGLYLQGGDFSAATFDSLTATGNWIQGFTAEAATATLSNCEADRNGRGWAAVTNGALTVASCRGDGNAVGAYAVSATILLNYDSITNSSAWDLYCVSSTCAPTGGNYGDWVTLSQNSDLTYRHLLTLRVIDAAASPLSNYWVYVSDRFGNPAVAQTKTDASGYANLTVSDRRVQPDDSRTFYTPHTIHLGVSPIYNVTTVIESDWNVTLYATGDADNDSIPDSQESDANVSWFDATNHVNQAGQLNASNPFFRAAVARDEDGSFLKSGTFPNMSAGTYRIGFEAWTNESGAPLTLSVVNQAETELLAATQFALNGSIAWYLSPAFDLADDDRPSILISDPDMRAAGSILISSLLIERIVNESDGNTTARPGMATNPVNPDTDFDGAPDGVERRNSTFWQEAELVGFGSFARVTDESASSGAAAEHGYGDDTVVETAFDGLVPGHDYQLSVRAKALSDPGSARAWAVLADDSSEYWAEPVLGAAFSWVQGATVTAPAGGVLVVRVFDLDDPNPYDGNGEIRVDALLLADLGEVNEFNRFSNPLQRDTDFDGVLDGPELGSFFTADFANASEGERSEGTAVFGNAVALAYYSDWVNVSVPVRYDGDTRFYIPPGIRTTDGDVEARRNLTENLLIATLSNDENQVIPPDVNFSMVYMGSSSPPIDNGFMELSGWYSWVCRNLTAGTYHLKLSINSSAATDLQHFAILVDRIYVQKRTLDPLNSDVEGDGLTDGYEVSRGMFALNPDSDYDHLSDKEEVFAGSDGFVTDPLKSDTDGDGLPDAVEVSAYGDADPGNQTDPTKMDTDGDGLPDGWIDGWSYGKDVRGATSAISFKDGIKQPWEGEDLNLDGAVNTSAFSVDRSDSARSTGGETDPKLADTDSDGMPDGWELWVRDFNTTAHAWGNDPLILNPRANDSETDSDVNRTTFLADPDGLTNLQEFLADTAPFWADTDQDYARDGDEANVTLRTVVHLGFRNSTNFESADSSSWIYFDTNPYDGNTGTAYWYSATDHNVTENYAGSLFHGGKLIKTIADGGAVLFNPSLNRIHTSSVKQSTPL
jgi:hypothetical protein